MKHIGEICLSLFLVLALSSVTTGSAFGQAFVSEDWDTTATVPDEVRGWGRPGQPGILEHDPETGNFLRATDWFWAQYIAVPYESEPDLWFANDYVGDKDYAEMDVTAIGFSARHDVFGNFQRETTPISIVLLSSELVPNPEFPSELVSQFVWTVSENVVRLGDGWTPFAYEVPSQSQVLPPNWGAFPAVPDTWSNVIQDVDRIIIIFGPFQIGIGGIASPWRTGIDNFTIQLGRPAEIPALNRFGLFLLVAGIFFIVVVNRHRFHQHG